MSNKRREQSSKREEEEEEEEEKVHGARCNRDHPALRKKKEKKHQGQSLRTVRLHHAEHRPLNPFSTRFADTCEIFLLTLAKKIHPVDRFLRADRDADDPSWMSLK